MSIKCGTEEALSTLVATQEEGPCQEFAKLVREGQCGGFSHQQVFDDKKSCLVANFTHYFPCARFDPEYGHCGTVMSRAREDLLEPGSPGRIWRRHCNCCKGCIRRSFGVVIEIMLPPSTAAPEGVWLYMRDGDPMHPG